MVPIDCERSLIGTPPSSGRHYPPSSRTSTVIKDTELKSWSGVRHKQSSHNPSKKCSSFAWSAHMLIDEHLSRAALCVDCVDIAQLQENDC